MNAPLSIEARALVTLLLSPLVAFFLLLVLRWFSVKLSEPLISRVTRSALGVALLSYGCLLLALVRHHQDQITVDLGSWFELTHYRFALVFLIDTLSLSYLGLSLALLTIVGHFSSRYLHRDSGYYRFFLLFLLSAQGLSVLTVAGTVDLLFFGWELLGLSSALLIAFFDRRREPIEGGLHAFALYRITDVGLLLGAVLMHHYAATAEFNLAFGQTHWPYGAARIHGLAAHLICFLFILAAMGKSAQFPFSSWLPRAMEGPTPSSAIFYGGISVHAGVYLLLRAAPLLDQSWIARAFLVLVGLSTAVIATLSGRIQADAKNQLAFASMAQVGVIFVEIGLGLRFLALVHVLGHASVRTLQFLRAPSVLAEFHRIRSGRDSAPYAQGIYYERLLPPRLRRILYGFALARGGTEALMERLWSGRVTRLLRRMEQFEARVFTDTAAPQEHSPLPEVISKGSIGS